MSSDAFHGQTVLITGAASGIGLATTAAFLEAGARVAMADLDPAALQSAIDQLDVHRDRVLAIPCDISKEEQVAAMVEQAVQNFGRIDIAYNNAGVHAPVADTADARSEDFDRLMSINLRGTWLCMKYELQVMRDQGSGAIVNCSSQSGITASPGLGAYVASKFAVIGMSQAAALEYAPHGIRINIVCPGPTDTPMVAGAKEDHPESMQAVLDGIPLGRLGRPEEIASAVLWLASPGAGFMIGQTVVPDGGYTVP